MVVQETFKEAQNMPTINPKEKKARRVFNLVQIFLSIIIRIFTQDNPSVHCTVINGVLHIELN